jgi:hypothetical protein
MTHIRLPSSPHWHFSNFFIITLGIISRRTRNWCQYFKLGVDSLLHFAICRNSLASQVLFKGSKRQEITEPHTVNRKFDSSQLYDREIKNCNPFFPIFHPVKPISFICLIWLSRELQQTSTWSNLPTPSSIHLTSTSVTPRYKPWCPG